MYKLEIHPLVEADFTKAALYYDSSSIEIFEHFKDSLKNAYSSIRNTPFNYLVLVKSRNIRRISLKNFPYSVIYTVKGDQILILAIRHHKQREFWKQRK